MKTRLILIILAVGLAVALIAITSNRGNDGTGVVQTTPDEPRQAASKPAPQLTPIKTSSTQPASAPVIAPAAEESAPFDRVAARHEQEILSVSSAPTESQPSGELVVATTQPADPAPALMLTTRPVVSIRPSAFETECRQIQAAIETDQTTPRSDLLVMYSRTTAGSGKFRLAAAACAMFLDEFGDSHPQAAQMAIRMGDCLAPLDMNNIEIAEGKDGLRFRPLWRGASKPNAEHLYQAIAAYERAGQIAADENQRAEAMVKLGWVYRALNDWKTSTEVWDQCADKASQLRSGQEALYLAAENLTLMKQNQAAADRWNRLAAIDPNQSWAKAAKEKATAIMTLNQEGTK